MKKCFSIAVLSLIFVLFHSIATFAQEEKYSKIKVQTDKNGLQKIARLGIPLEGKFEKNEFFITELSQKEILLLKKNGFRYEVLVDDVSRFYQERNKKSQKKSEILKKTGQKTYVTPQHFHLGSMGGYLTLAELYAELDSMRAAFPNLITQRQTIGEFQTTQNRPLYFVKISDNPDVNENETEILYTGLHHAREPISMQQLIFMMWYLLENYNTDPEVQDMVNNSELYFVPCVNPDGYFYNQSTNPNGGGMWRKNRRNSGGGNYGVDPNRNYTFHWGYDNSGSSPDPSSDTYRGPSAGSEPEIQAVIAFCEQHNFSIAFNHHTYGNLLLYPWSYIDQPTPDEAVFNAFAQILTEVNHFTYGRSPQVLYATNGDAKDYMYGEQTTKNKIIPFTPETGSDVDGFWPEIDRIVPLCEGNMQMNLTLIQLAGKFLKLQDANPLLIAQREGFLKFDMKCLGLDTTGNFTISITPLNAAIQQIGQPKTLTNWHKLEQRTDSISYVLNPNLATGSLIKYILAVDNGRTIRRDTISKIFGQPSFLINDPCNNFQNWTSTTGWNTTNTASHSPSSSITDSPTGNYQNNANTEIRLIQPISLENSSMSMLNFWVKWDLETNYDYVQLFASVNNTNWIPLQGKFTRNGSGSLPNEPLYTGNNADWVNEEVDLQQFLGQNVYFKFVLKSDGSAQKDGFYFDDFSIWSVSADTASPRLNFPAEFSFTEDSSATFDVSNYIHDSTDSLNSLNISFTGNTNIEASRNEKFITFSSKTPNWNGFENITINVSDAAHTVSASVKISCTAVNDAPELSIPDSLVWKEDITETLDFSNYISDVDNPANSLILNVQATQYSVSQNQLQYTFTPNPNWFGTDTLNISLSDGLLSVNKKVKIICKSENDAPILNIPDTVIFFEDSSLTLETAISDVDDAELIFSYTGGSHLRFENFNGNLKISAKNENWNGTETAQLKVSDSKLSTTKKIVVKILSINDIPQFKNLDSLEFQEDKTQEFDFSQKVFDNDNSAWTLKLFSQENANIKIEINGLKVKFSSKTKNWNGKEIISLGITDGIDSTTTNLVVNCLPVNDLPIISGQKMLSTDKNVALKIKLSDLQIVDVDNDSTELQISILDGTNYTHKGDSLIPAKDFVGNLMVLVQVNDGIGNSNSYPLVVNVKIPANIENLQSENFNIFPNPTSESIFVEWKNEKFAKIEIFDVNGKLVKTFNNVSSGTKISNLQLKSGIYSIRCTTKNQMFTKKLIVK